MRVDRRTLRKSEAADTVAIFSSNHPGTLENGQICQTSSSLKNNVLYYTQGCMSIGTTIGP